jgi:hypothetical protein
MGLLMVAWTMSAGCAPSSRSEDLGIGESESYLPPSMCPACVMEPAPPAPPPSYNPDFVCYDGCNWCYCTAEGLVFCTARGCSPDGGTLPGPGPEADAGL